MKNKPITLLFVFTLTAISASAQQWKQYIDSAALLNSQRDYRGAVAYYEKAKAQWEQEKKGSNEYIQLCTAMGIVYISLNDPTNAAKLFAEARTVAEKLHGKMDKAYARTTTFLANVYTNLNRHSEAETLFLEARDLREKLYGKETEEYAQTCNNLAELYRTMGLYEKAEPLSTEARAVRGKLNQNKGSRYAISTTGLANLYRDMGQYEKAEALYREAKQLRLDTFGRVHPDYAASCNILADLYHYMNRYAEAEKLYLEAREIREQLYKTKINAAYAQSCNNLSGLYLDMGRYNEAEALALEASGIWRQTLEEGHQSHPIGFANIGSVYFEMGHYPKAEEYLLKARTIWEKALGKDHPLFINNSLALARVYWCQKNRQKAEALYLAALEGQQKQLSTFFAFTNEKEKETFIRNILGVGHEYYSFFFQQQKIENRARLYDLSLLKRNMILNSGQQLQWYAEEEATDQVRATYLQWTAAREQVARLTTGSTRTDSTLKAWEERAEKLEKELTKNSVTFRKQKTKETTTYKAIQQRLDENEAAIEFIEFAHFNGKKWTDSVFYLALVLTKRMTYPSVIKLFEKKQLEVLLEQVKERRAQEVVGQLYGGSPSVYNLVWRPLQKKLRGISTVYFAPAGLLHRVPMAALSIDGRRLLSDQYRLVQLNTTASVASPVAEGLKPSDSLVLYGGVEYAANAESLRKEARLYASKQNHSLSLPDDLSRGDKWDALPGSAIEVAGIERAGLQKQYNVKSLQGISATEESIKGLRGRSSPAVLHIATHGFFFPDPKENVLAAKFATSGKVFKQSDNPLFRSGLLLAGANNTWQGKQVDGIEDGILTAYEVSNLYLPNTKLVVLSACETALGDIRGSEGVYGLQRAFKMAGVQHLLMSLWKVPDVETAEFMQAFYKPLLKGESISTAFHKAQTAMKNKYRDEPYKWAAWVLIK